MASQVAEPAAAPTAQLVANAFVQQYYHILHCSPESVFRFYQDSSMISRPDSSGVMTDATTMNGINQKILSLDYGNYKAEINTADAQKSYNDGVTVLVTGCLTSKDNMMRRKFAQSFFLAPQQDNGYFVLNDVFRYVEDEENLEKQPVNGTDDSIKLNSIPVSVPSIVHDPPAPEPVTTVEESHQSTAERASDRELPLVNEKDAVVETDTQSHPNGNDDSTVVVEMPSSSTQEDTPKKSYASIVKVPKGSPGPTRVYVPTNTAKGIPKKTDTQPISSAAPAPLPEASALTSADADNGNNTHRDVAGHSIYIRNLPFDITESQLELEFKKFGPIKKGGIQVRNSKQQGNCFGFIEFLSLSSMTQAVEVSPINIKGCQTFIEAKRTSRGNTFKSLDVVSLRQMNYKRGNSGPGGSGRFFSGRGGFRNDSFRVHGHYGGGGGRSFGRNEYGNNRGEFSERGRGLGRGGEGRGRGQRSNGPRQNTGADEYN